MRGNAYSYFPELTSNSVRVELVSTSERPLSRLRRFRLRAEDARREVLVKTMKARPDRHDRPRLGGAPDSEALDARQHLALSGIHEHFRRLDDRRFGTVRPLDHVPELHALVMEFIAQPTLRQLLGRDSRLRRPFTHGALARGFRNAGAWLRSYHDAVMPGVDGMRSCDRSDVLRKYLEYAEYLGTATGDESFFSQAGGQATRVGETMLPPSLPSGVSHGDYAPRNVLVGPDQQVTIFDASARTKTPVYEDIARFTIALRMSATQVLTGGQAHGKSRITLYERSFLAGYFGDRQATPIAVSWYEALILLDKWAAFVAGRAPAGRTMPLDIRLSATNRAFKRETKRLLATLSRS